MMVRSLWVAAAVALVCAQASAQTASTPAKKELAAKIVQTQQGSVDQMARQLVEQPALQLLQRAIPIVQSRVPADQREAVVRELQADARKYVEDTLPIVSQRARALATLTIGPVLEAKMSESELKEVLSILESATWRKFQGLAPDMQKALGEKLMADMKAQMETRLKALQQAMSKRLGSYTPASAPASGK
jgi:hypothetical protein